MAGLGPGCVKTLRGIPAPRILRLVVTLRAKKRKNSSDARHYDQISFRFRTAWVSQRLQTMSATAAAFAESRHGILPGMSTRPRCQAGPADDTGQHARQRRAVATQTEMGPRVLSRALRVHLQADGTADWTD
jgi:hypothetical protein